MQTKRILAIAAIVLALLALLSVLPFNITIGLAVILLAVNDLF